MKVHEYQAKEILKGYGVPVPRGRVAESPEESRKIAEEIGAKRIVEGSDPCRRKGQRWGLKCGQSRRGRENCQRDTGDDSDHSSDRLSR
jgi:succinyl-CoA synthetase beta subunit